MKRILAAACVAAIWGSLAEAASSVWKVEKEGSVFYIGGTCHFLREKDLPCPPEFDRAYAAADLLVLETDLGKLQEPETRNLVMAKAVYADGSTLDKHLSAPAYEALAAYCASNGIPVAQLAQFRPSFVMTALTAAELAKMGATGKGVDLIHYERARKDGKPVEELETIEEQIEAVMSMSDGIESDFVLQSLRDIHKAREQIETMLAAWRKGDMTVMGDLLVRELKDKAPQVYQRMLVDRNERWLARIETYRKTPRIEFFLVGAGHLAGPDSVLQSLGKRGYKVTPL
ncbi:MAG: TraB/GumN family protein [Verrucomicrobia bacterium]|nr:TraB/GumN family protein [Verrucomicrobiota bacterium]